MNNRVNTVYIAVKGGDSSIRTIRERRIALGVTQAELSKRIGVTRVYLAMLENGARIPSERTKAALDGALEEFQVLRSACHLDVMIDYVRIHFVRPDRALGKAV